MSQFGHPALQIGHQCRRHAGVSANPQQVSDMIGQRRRSPIKQRDPGDFAHRRGFDPLPGCRQAKQLFGRDERRRGLGEAGAFFFGQFERMDQAKPVDQPVGELGRDDFAAQPVVQNIALELGPHRFWESCQ